MLQELQISKTVKQVITFSQQLLWTGMLSDMWYCKVYRYSSGHITCHLLVGYFAGTTRPVLPISETYTVTKALKVLPTEWMFWMRYKTACLLRRAQQWPCYAGCNYVLCWGGHLASCLATTRASYQCLGWTSFPHHHSTSWRQLVPPMVKWLLRNRRQWSLWTQDAGCCLLIEK
jgi:hypothetical protein